MSSSSRGGRRSRTPHLTKRVGKYYVGRTIGEGTYAKVKYAQHMDTGEAVALKVLDKEHLVRTNMVEQVKREITILKQVHHPYVVDLKEVMSSKDKIFLVMELVTGGDLFDKIADEGPMKEEPARILFSQLLSALGNCHARGVYHRDLKPENVLLSSEGDVKLSDFGLGAVRQADTVGSAGLLNTICGTPNYAAPEVLAKLAYDGAAADVWSLGVVLYVVLAGCLPFDEDDLVALFKKVASAEYETPPWLSPAAADCLSTMLQADPADRPTVEELWEHTWMKGVRRPVSPTSSSLGPVPESEEAQSEAAIDGGAPSSTTDGDGASSTDVFSPTVCKEALGPGESVGFRDSPERSPRRLNAFELINDYLDISGIFEARDDVVTRRTRFSSAATVPRILGAIENAAVAVGGRVEKRTDEWVRVYIPNIKGPIRVVARALEVLPGKRIVDLQKVSGNTLEFYQWYHDLTGVLESLVSKERKSVMAQPKAGDSMRTKRRLNAFELIGSSLNVGAMFDLDEDASVRSVQFSSRAAPKVIAKAIAEGARALGGEVSGTEDGRSLLQIIAPVGAGRTVSVTLKPLLELLPGLWIAQLSKGSGGSMLDVYKFYNRLAGGYLREVMMRRNDGQLTHPMAARVGSLVDTTAAGVSAHLAGLMQASAGDGDGDGSVSCDSGSSGSPRPRHGDGDRDAAYSAGSQMVLPEEAAAAATGVTAQSVL